MLKAVIFDVDGTLIDSVDAHARSWTETLRKFGYDVEFAEVRYQIGKGGDQLMAKFLPPADIKEQGKEIEEARKKRFNEYYLPGVEAFPKTRELFKALLSEELKLVLATSAAGDELSSYKQKADIADLVQEETSKDDAEKSKPHPDIFEAAASKLHGIAKSEMIVVGDSPWDAIAANRAGLRSVGVLCGGFPERDLRDAGNTDIYRDPADILRACREFVRI